jgi:hypothetical protein
MRPIAAAVPLLLSLSFLVLATSCRRERARAEPVARAASVPRAVPLPAGDPDPVVVVQGQPGRKVDPKTSKSIINAVRTLTKGPAEQPSAADRAAGMDPGKLVGRWQIVHTIHKTNGKAGAPARPIVPAQWELTRDGRLLIKGGMTINARYIYTGEALIISGLGPKQTYTIARLTASELEVVATIAAGSLRIENTTVLKRL